MGFRSTVLAVVTAALAISAIAVADAAALPSFEPGSGKFPAKFSLKGKEVQFQEIEGETMVCGTSKGEGEVTGKQTATAKLTMTECRILPGDTCQTAGAKRGEIKTGVLPVELVYLSKEHKEAGLVFNYENPTIKPPPNLTFAGFQCEGVGLGMRHSVIVPVTPVNTKSLSYSLKFAGAGGLQKPAVYENEAGQEIKAVAQMGLITSNWNQGDMIDSMELTTTAGEAIEIKA
jgi:hypothetical protein